MSRLLSVLTGVLLLSMAPNLTGMDPPDPAVADGRAEHHSHSTVEGPVDDGADLDIRRFAWADRPILKRVPQLQATARMSNHGALGCGEGTLRLVTSRGVVTAQTDLDPFHVFGHTVRTADLLVLLQSRVESNRTGLAGPMAGQVSDLCYVCLSALAVSKEPDAVPVLADLLADGDDTICGWAAIALFRLGDSDEGLRGAVREVRFPGKSLASAGGRGCPPPAWLGLGE